MKKLRIGLVGAGKIVQEKQLPNLLRRADVSIAALCNSRAESSRMVADKFRIPEVVRNWADMMARPDIDAVWIGTPPHLHAPLTVSALEAGKHVFCQARMAMNLEEAREMLSVSRARPELVTMLCPAPHGMKHGRFFTKLLRDGYAGDLFHFRLEALNSQFSDPHAPLHWRQRRELVGLNVLTLGIYGEVIGEWLGQPRRLHAQMKVSIPRHESPVPSIPDLIQVIGQWTGGLAGNLEWSGVAQFARHETLQVFGSEGSLVYDFTTDEIFGARRGQKELQLLEVPPEYVREWRVEDDFVEAVLQGGNPEPSFETGVAYMEFVEAIHRSARGGHAIELPL